jgi:hypothetical protein
MKTPANHMRTIPLGGAAAECRAASRTPVI